MPEQRLSQRELEVLKLMALGHSTCQVALLLGLSPHTVATYRGRLRRKLGLRRRRGFVQAAQELRLLSPGGEEAGGGPGSTAALGAQVSAELPKAPQGPTSKIKVAVAANNGSVWHRGLLRLLSQHDDLDVVDLPQGEAVARQTLREMQPDWVLLLAGEDCAWKLTPSDVRRAAPTAWVASLCLCDETRLLVDRPIGYRLSSPATLYKVLLTRQRAQQGPQGHPTKSPISWGPPQGQHRLEVGA